MRKGVKVAVVGGVFTVMVGGAGYGAYNLVTAVAGGNTVSSHGSEHKSGPPSGDEVKDTAERFLAAWAKNDPAEAARLTDYAENAMSVLEDWHERAHVTRTELKATKADGTKVAFHVKATVSYGGKTRTMAYDSSLKVVRGKTTGRALVDWSPAVVHPALKKGDTLVTGKAAAPPIEAVDRDGAVLSDATYPSLGPVLDQLRAKYGDFAGGSPGIETYVERTTANGDTTTAKTLLTLAKGKTGKLRTTLSATAQAAAEQAVRKYPESSVVAVKASTGEVLAVANQEKGEFNAAFQGGNAPGSVMKIVSAAALIDNGVTSANGPAPCPDSAVALSQTFHNLKGLRADENATLANSFARSCNTAFIKLSDDLGAAEFAAEAKDRFGLGKDWKTGIVSRDGSVEMPGNSDDAAALIGHGQVKMNPLNMASVTATAITGAFHQPVLVPRDLDDRQLATAQGLRPGTSGQLKQMMRLTATSGTAAQAMAGVPGDKGAKTGSADVDGQGNANSWFAGYRDDVTAAATVPRGGHGGDAAGPIVAAVLRAGS
ncbi:MULTISPECIES: penicillin-binding transpeptidase domain-containing protein [unclassified Streptomyces]|uniref:penicillin-binding transpeptidase domain-containing protein n=1 Tax=unclassified Streptomyces TaxID=2593676 RepID=UPI00278C7731|nr:MULTISPECIES: penicillin-binding transpeptidase domain-containing protein [unclassified Streptomyces]